MVNILFESINLNFICVLLKQTLKKITVIAVGACILSGCDAVKRVQKDDLLLTENTFIVNGKINKSETLSKLSFQKVNNKFLGIPFKLHVYNLARPNKDSIFESWINKRLKRYQRYEKLFSKKQMENIKKSALGFNNWLRNTGEIPEVLDTLKINKTKLNLERY